MKKQDLFDIIEEFKKLGEHQTIRLLCAVLAIQEEMEALEERIEILENKRHLPSSPEGKAKELREWARAGFLDSFMDIDDE